MSVSFNVQHHIDDAPFSGHGTIPLYVHYPINFWPPRHAAHAEYQITDCLSAKYDMHSDGHPLRA